MIKEVLPGTIRVKVKDLKCYEKTKKGWKKSKDKFSNINVVKMFKVQKNFNALVDTKDSRFLKGQLYDGKCQGARINILPDGRKLDKAYSLFAKNLCIHDQKSNEHWDVLFQNPSGGFAYVYTLDKKSKAKVRKFKKVHQFEKVYPKLKKAVEKNLKKGDILDLAMFTLLNTYMRVGTEIYYKARKHKGLTTLKKEDVKIKGNVVIFDYVAKDGVPRKIVKEFSKIYVNLLKKRLKSLKKDSFVFADANGRPLKDMKFKALFKEYCGKEFYPHIVRSFHATYRAEVFLKGHKKYSKDEMRDFFTSLAVDLGHKKYSKKEGVWKDSYTVTLNHYVDPLLVEKIKSCVD